MKYFTKNVFAFLLTMTMVGLNSATAQIWSYDFGDEAAFNTDWVNGGTNEGAEVWTWTDDVSPMIALPDPEFAATTATNGYIFFNSDANGENNPHDVAITTTSPIDCSAASSVFLQFESQYAQFYGPVASVGVSTDGMVFTYHTVLADVEQADITPVSTVIVELPEAANQSEVWIEFRWQGTWEYIWKIDDIMLLDFDPSPSTDFSFGDVFYSPASFAQPILQIATDTMAFEADVVNNGTEDLTNATVVGTITNEAGDVLFTTEETMDAIPPDSTVTFTLPDLYAPDQLELGVYNFNYEVTADQMDPNPADNSFSEVFLITEDLWSKDNATITGTRPSGDTDYILANLYTAATNLLPNTRYFANVQFNAVVNAVDAPLAGKEATIVLARVDDNVVDPGWNTFDVNADLTTNTGLILEAFIPHVFEGENYDIQEVALTDFDENPIAIQPGARYILGIQYSGDNNVIFQGIANDLDYFQISTIVYSSQWFLGGFGPETSATIRATTNMGVNAEDTPLPVESMSLFPNPTSDNIALDINLENTGLANILIGDMTGKIMDVQEYDNLANGTYTFDVSKYPNGVYMARLVTADGSRTIKFTVQH